MTKKTVLEIAEETAQAVKRIEDVTGKSVRSFVPTRGIDGEYLPGEFEWCRSVPSVGAIPWAPSIVVVAEYRGVWDRK